MSATFDLTFKVLFDRYYSGLLFYATRIVGNEEEAEDVVQDVFADLWRRREVIETGDKIQSFLYKSTYTRALNVIKRRSVSGRYRSAESLLMQERIRFYRPENSEVLKQIESAELQREITAAIDALPDKCREVFTLSYLHDLKNKEIAELLQISLRTVEAHMYRALKLLRSSLKAYRMLWILFFMYWK